MAAKKTWRDYANDLSKEENASSKIGQQNFNRLKTYVERKEGKPLSQITSTVKKKKKKGFLGTLKTRNARLKATIESN